MINHILIMINAFYLHMYIHKDANVIFTCLFLLQKINDLFEELGIPFKMMEGIIQIVNVKIPWLSLRDLNSYFLMKDVHLTLRPNPLDTDDGNRLFNINYWKMDNVNCF